MPMFEVKVSTTPAHAPSFASTLNGVADPSLTSKEVSAVRVRMEANTDMDVLDTVHDLLGASAHIREIRVVQIRPESL